MNDGTRKIIDYAYEDEGTKFRDALYTDIADRVHAHIDLKKAEIAQTMVGMPTDGHPAPETGVPADAAVETQ